MGARRFRDPLADAIVRVTNWLILPLRRVLPPIGKLDTATVVACSPPPRFAASRDGHGRRKSRDAGLFLRNTVVNLAELVLYIYLFAFSSMR